MMHEEVIRLELMCLEKKVLVKNEMTGSYERDDAVFQAASLYKVYVRVTQPRARARGYATRTGHRARG